jgi:hypothetical protein
MRLIVFSRYSRLFSFALLLLLQLRPKYCFTEHPHIIPFLYLDLQNVVALESACNERGKYQHAY